MNDRCFDGYFEDSDSIVLIMASLYSSYFRCQKIIMPTNGLFTWSPVKSDETCNMRRSTESSLPVRSSVVTAAVKIDLLSSATRLSSSTLHSATVAGFLAAIEFKALTAPNRKTVLGEERRSCNTIMEECKILESTSDNIAIFLKHKA